jgi:hypothetical protein
VDSQIVVSREDGEIRLPIEDLAWIVIDSPQVSLSTALLSACMDAGMAIVTTDRTHIPSGLILPFHRHHWQAGIAAMQIGISAPLRKRLWQIVVQAKIANQAASLESVGQDGTALRSMMRLVVSGDLDNVEARAARTYWPRLFVGRHQARTAGSLPVQKFFERRQLYDAAVLVDAQVCRNEDGAVKHIAKVTKNLPSSGSIRAVQVTDRQYSRMRLLLGEATENRIGRLPPDGPAVIFRSARNEKSQPFQEFTGYQSLPWGNRQGSHGADQQLLAEGVTACLQTRSAHACTYDTHCDGSEPVGRRECRPACGSRRGGAARRRTASGDADPPRDLPVALPVGALVDDRGVVHRRLDPPRRVDGPGRDRVLAR